MKQCFKCHELLPTEKFYRHPMMADGRLGKCIKCTKLDSITNRVLNLARCQEYDRLRYKTPKRTAQIQRNSKRRGWKWNTKKAAGKKINNAIKAGRILRKPCEVCGNPKSHGHHRDYSKPLEVIWLCALHHFAAHRKYDYDEIIKRVKNNY